MAFIILENIRKHYEIGDFLVLALDGIDLSIGKNEFVNIQGASGAGKTTLLNIMGSLDKPTSGKVLIDGINIATLTEESLSPWRAVNLGFVFQSFNLISTLTAEENVAIPALLWQENQDDVAKRVTELLDMVQMHERGDHLPMQLSAGEKQRIAIARALMNDPPLLIADEPTANLDAGTATMIIQIFKEIKESGDKTIIIASHDERMAQLATRNLFMNAGKLEEMGEDG
ncbi:ATP-binding cassette domain-containing protein [Candidatus Bathyarchaeota archaeon]|nr:ATP-binding cassette domain-containing protein [Candidatus Bathyarchaeota archaeon]